MTAKRAVGFAPCEFCNEWSASACGVACEIRSFLSSPPAVPVPRVMSLVDTGKIPVTHFPICGSGGGGWRNFSQLLWSSDFNSRYLIRRFYPSNFLFSVFGLFWSSIGFVKSCRAIVHGKRLCSAKGAVLLCFGRSLCHRVVIHCLCSWFQVAFWFVLGISVG